jgi:hypothetical protein
MLDKALNFLTVPTEVLRSSNFNTFRLQTALTARLEPKGFFRPATNSRVDRATRPPRPERFPCHDGRIGSSARPSS